MEKGKKRKFIVGFLVLATVMLVASGGIYAYFNDTESTHNGIQTGSLDLIVNTQNPWTTAPFIIGSPLVYPGFTNNATPISLILTNSDNMAGTLTMNFTNMTGLPGTTLEPEALLGPDLGELQNYIHIRIDQNSVGTIYNDTLIELNNDTIDLGTLATGSPITLNITYWVDSTVGNVIMGDLVNFDIVFVLIQTPV
jgi:predicted ribosomally synthesized peptide with SipW-like signal peptide